MKEHVKLLLRMCVRRPPPARKARAEQEAVLGGRTGAQRARLYFAAIDERDWRSEDHPLASPQSGVYFHPGAQVACDPDGADLGFAILDDGRLQAIAVEEQGLRRNGEGRRLARYLGLDPA